ncbi:MAG: hypothetical protein DRO98_03470 [Archaeoglobales archaeon]|nr:MAG: hypothetical protein DRO98_03470 [Archaeoglobales archaeon]
MANQIAEMMKDLKEVRDKIDSIIETLEIMADKELMESIKKAKDEPKKREFREYLKEIGVDIQE